MCSLHDESKTKIGKRQFSVNLKSRKISTVSKSLYTTPLGSMRVLPKDSVINQKHAQNIASKISISMTKPTTTSSMNSNTNYVTWDGKSKSNKMAYGSILNHSGIKVRFSELSLDIPELSSCTQLYQEFIQGQNKK